MCQCPEYTLGYSNVFISGNYSNDAVMVHAVIQFFVCFTAAAATISFDGACQAAYHSIVYSRAMYSGACRLQNHIVNLVIYMLVIGKKIQTLQRKDWCALFRSPFAAPHVHICTSRAKRYTRRRGKISIVPRVNRSSTIPHPVTLDVGKVDYVREDCPHRLRHRHRPQRH